MAEKKGCSPVHGLKVLEMFEDCIEADRDRILFTEDLDELRTRFASRGLNLDSEARAAWTKWFGPTA